MQPSASVLIEHCLSREQKKASMSLADLHFCVNCHNLVTDIPLNRAECVLHTYSSTALRCHRAVIIREYVIDEQKLFLNCHIAS